MNVANLDLNLLVSLDALLHQRSVTRAAQQVGLSQPALSAALARLRRHFGDDLLVRVGNENRLTPLAEQLQSQSRLALQSVHRVFTAQPAFDPASSTREFTLLLSDYCVAVLGSALTELLGQEAPGARLKFVPHSPDIVARADQALLAADLLLLPRGFLDDLPAMDLFTDDWVLIADADNPEVGEAVTVDQLRELPWVTVYSGQTASTPATRILRMQGIDPHVQVVTEAFLTVPGLVARSPRIAVLQRRLLGLLPTTSALRVLPAPVDLGHLVEAAYWHPVYARDPEHSWLRDLVLRAARQVTAPG
ncbi:LysR family transcriptional regulator [Geodermatophilaceae bacterium NBWT11]|nr:LysR family transcriptional regulator [Geodermatophilaceae bacterium NBWT11]